MTLKTLKNVVVSGAMGLVLAAGLACGPVTGSGTTPVGDPCEGTPECVPGSICFNEYCVGEGALRVSLGFTTNSDFDLHLLLPSDDEIYFGNDEEGGGVLDVDQCISGCEEGASHVENIVFSASAPSGRYEVWVRNYNGNNSGSFTIDVVGEANHQFSGTLPATLGAESEHFIFSK